MIMRVHHIHVNPSRPREIADPAESGIQCKGYGRPWLRCAFSLCRTPSRKLTSRRIAPVSVRSARHVVKTIVTTRSCRLRIARQARTFDVYTTRRPNSYCMVSCFREVTAPKKRTPLFCQDAANMHSLRTSAALITRTYGRRTPDRAITGHTIFYVDQRTAEV